MATQTLSKNSTYEQTFGTRHRGPGRPSGEDVFPRSDVHPLLRKVAQRRAFAVVHENNKEELAELYSEELAVLKRRGVEQVAADLGIELEDGDA